MKVAMIVANNVAPDPRVVREAQILRSAGHEMSFYGLALHSGAPSYSDVPGKINLLEPPGIVQVGKRLVKSSSRRNPSRIEKFARNLTRNFYVASQFRAIANALKGHVPQILSFRPDVIHAHDLNALPAAVFAARKSGAKVVYDSHELFTELGNYSFLYKRFLARVERKCLRYVSHVVTVSDLVAAELKHRYQFNKISLFRNIPPGKPIAPGRLNAPISFLYHGGVSSNRGIEELLDAFASLPPSVHCSLKIRGFGPLLPKLEQAASDPGLRKRLVLASPIPPEKLIQEASAEDVGIIAFSPSSLNNRYALPNKYFEYMLAGLAILSNGELQEIRNNIQKHGSGFCFNRATPPDIAQTITELSKEPQRIQKAKECSYQAALSECNIENESLQLLGIYESLITGSLESAG